MTHLRGKFIVFDGPEGCGKTTQTRMLKEHLESQGLPVQIFRDPGTTHVGEQVRQILLDPKNDDMAMRCEMLLYMASRSQMVRELILPALKNNDVVLCDRFVSSTLAYQLGGDGLTADEIKTVAEVAIHGRWPDRTIILDIPLEKSSKRVIPKFILPFPQNVQSEIAKEMTHDRIEMRPAEYHERVRQNYLKQAAADPKQYRVINAERPPGVVFHDVLKALESL
jgi:dTMP kinase